MARLTGANLTVYWVDGSGTIEVPTVRSFNPGDGFDTAETSAAGDNMRSHALTLQTFEPSMEYVDFDTTEPGINGTLSVVAGSILRSRLYPGARGTIEWYERGTAAGSPKGAMDVWCLRNQAPITYDDTIVRTVDFRAASGVWVADPGTATV